MWHRYLLISLIVCCMTHLQGQVRTLDYYISHGVSNSPMLKDLNNQIRMNSIDSLVIKANRNPKISFNGNLSYAPIYKDFGYSYDITNGGLFSTLLSFNQEIFTGKKTANEYSRLGLMNQSLANTGKITEKEVTKAITLQYIEVYFAFKEMELNREILKSLQDEDIILKQLTEKGMFKQTDYLSFLLERQSQELICHGEITQFHKELLQLNLVSGVDDTATGITLSLPEINRSPAAALAKSPFFLRFRLDSLSIQNQRSILDKNYKPKISWVGDAGIVNNVPANLYKNFGISLGVSLSLPVYDGNQRKLYYQKLKTTEETRKTWQDYFSHQYDMQLQQLKDELARTNSIIPEIEKQLSTSALLLKADRELLDKGDQPVTDYLLAIKNHIGFQKSLIQSRRRILQILTEINYWEQ